MKSNKVKILIAEDEELFLRKLTNAMETNGFKVLQARNGHEAVDIVKKTTPDIIILDLLMPFTEGFKTIRLLRSYYSIRTVPMIILSNLKPYDKLLQSTMQEKLIFYMNKTSFQLDSLKDMIKNILSM